MSIASQAGYRRVANAVKRFEPFVPWNRRFLEYRLICYRHAHDPLAETAQKDLEDFLKQAPAADVEPAADPVSDCRSVLPARDNGLRPFSGPRRDTGDPKRQSR